MTINSNEIQKKVQVFSVSFFVSQLNIRMCAGGVNYGAKFKSKCIKVTVLCKVFFFPFLFFFLFHHYPGTAFVIVLESPSFRNKNCKIQKSNCITDNQSVRNVLPFH